MNKTTFYPKTHLFPHHPQVLHQMVLQFFLLTDKHMDYFPKDEETRALCMPYGSYFDTGVKQAAGYRFLLGKYKPKKIVLITGAALPDKVNYLTCSYKALHSFISEMAVDESPYTGVSPTVDNELFAQHADPIVCQLPFLRSYQKIDAISPIMYNNKKTDLNREDFWSAIYDQNGETCYILCINGGDETMERIAEGYFIITGQRFLTLE